MKRLPLWLTLLALIALSVSCAFWVLRLLQPAQRAVAAAPLQARAAPTVDAASTLFGGQKAAAVSNVQLRGVVAVANGRGSAAIVSYDNKPAQALGVGEALAPGITVKQVEARYVMLLDGGVEKRVEMVPLPAKGAPAAAETAPVPRPTIPVPADTPSPDVPVSTPSRPNPQGAEAAPQEQEQEQKQENEQQQEPTEAAPAPAPPQNQPPSQPAGNLRSRLPR